MRPRHIDHLFRIAFVGTVLFSLLVVRTRAQLIRSSSGQSAVPGFPTSRKFSSPNGKFSLVLDEATPATIVPVTDVDLHATMLAINGQASIAKWGRAFSASQLPWISENGVHVSDHGEFFVLIEKLGSRVSLFKENQSWTKTLERGSSSNLSDPIFKADELNGEHIFAYWQRLEKTWFALRVSDCMEIKIPADVSNRWNEEIRRGIIKKLEQTRGALLRKRIGRIPTPIAKLTGLTTTRADWSVREVDLEFLTSLHNPADRQWLEFFLNRVEEADPSPKSFWPNRFQTKMMFIQDWHVVAPDRVIADRLLAVWENKVQPATIPPAVPRPPSGSPIDGLFQFEIPTPPPPPHDGESPFYFVGKVSGEIHLSTSFTPYPRDGSGFYVILVPQNSGRPIESDFFEGNDRAYPRNRNPIPGINFKFHTVLPGAYRLKVIWDKRRPFTNTENAGPGDYESAFSAPFVVTAGGALTNLTIVCTNRIPGGEAWYAADELRAKLNP
jgi:hypothetical protein